MTIPRRILAVAVGALVLLPHTAHADEPLMEDPVGDAVPPPVCVSNSSGFETCSTTDPLARQPLPVNLVEPSIDIVEADLATHGNDLVVATSVVDVDAAASTGDDRVNRLYSTTAQAQGLQIDVVLWRQPGAHDQASLFVTQPGTYAYGRWDVAVTVDAATDSITWRIPLAVLDDARAQACAACPPIGRGTVLHDIQASASTRAQPGNVPYSSDYAKASRSYTIGER